MEIYEAAARLKEAEDRMRKSITEFEAASSRQWAEFREKVDSQYAAEMEEYRKKLASGTEARVNFLKESLSLSVKHYRSSKSRGYSAKARKVISEVIEL